MTKEEREQELTQLMQTTEGWQRLIKLLQKYRRSPIPEGAPLIQSILKFEFPESNGLKKA
jgi:hypothetical protein